MSAAKSMDVVQRAGRSVLAGKLERRLLELGLGAHGTLLIAASGGADSTALLLLATAVARRREWRIEAATVDHHLRDSSGADAAQVMELCTTIAVPCTTLDVHPEPGAGAPARARRDRYAALALHARERGIAAVLTAHHADDQLETMLLALVRGAGARAIGGMAECRRLAPSVTLVRPILETSGEALHRLCVRLGVSWCTDPTNADLSSPRIRLRTVILPELERLRPGAAARAAFSAALLRGAGRSFERRASGLVAPAIERARLRRKGRAWRLESVRQAVCTLGGRPSARLLAQIDAAIVDQRQHLRRWSAPGGVEIRLDAARLHFSAVRRPGADNAAAPVVRRR